MLQKVFVFLLFIMVGVFGRLVPHLANMTPLLALTVIAGCYFKPWQAVGLVLLTFALSDLALHYFLQIPAFGSWTVFTYSAAIIMLLASQRFAANGRAWTVMLLGVSASVFFWLWTNFGVWLLSDLYPHSWQGLELCYLAALPFFSHQFLATQLWLGVCLLLLKVVGSAVFSSFGFGSKEKILISD